MSLSLFFQRRPSWDFGNFDRFRVSLTNKLSTMKSTFLEVDLSLSMLTEGFIVSFILRLSTFFFICIWQMPAEFVAFRLTSRKICAERQYLNFKVYQWRNNEFHSTAWRFLLVLLLQKFILYQKENSLTCSMIQQWSYHYLNHYT